MSADSEKRPPAGGFGGTSEHPFGPTADPTKPPEPPPRPKNSLLAYPGLILIFIAILGGVGLCMLDWIKHC
jgi:hypothetical protein